MSWQGVEVVHVVAMDQQHCIGKNNALPWHLPADLQHFKALTQGGVVIMGRKTLESMGRTLPNRINWVITRNADWQFSGAKVADSIAAALNGALQDLSTVATPRLFIIGGGEIFTQTLDIADRLELTHVETRVGGDAFYPGIPADFVCQSKQSHYDEKAQMAFHFCSYVRQPA